ncbi:probable ATP-dependent RNA helicase DDX28 [Anoplolepis gracilipes]|uniref:probable ATP-dependent RNA helicase DDX28 n=1 Tax=Anoplolepis gracilipes TaxID=354296 RepID=UPI003B9DC715
MFSRFCNLCHKTGNVQFVQRCYKKGKAIKRKSNVSQIQIPKHTEGKTPIIVCKRKEFNFYEGQKYSKFEPIPLASKGWQHYKSKQDHFFIYSLTSVEEEAYSKESNEEEEKVCDTFTQFGLNPEIIKILEKYNITKPLKIQTVGIPQIMNGTNTVIAAETGCGKTLTYLLPMIDKILKWKTLIRKQYNSPLGLIITPTRELAFQIGVEAKKICQYLNICVKIITGGKTSKILSNPPVDKVDIIIGSFGVISKLTTHKVYKLDMVRSIVLDEADALFHKTFEEKLQIFLRRVPLGFMHNVYNDTKLPIGAQFALASATMPSRMSEVLKNIIDVQSLVHITSDKLHHILVPQKFMRVGPSDKPTELLKYIKPKVANREQVIIFSNTNSTCNWISMFLNKCNIENVRVHGEMPMYERQNKYASFKSSRCLVLCTTNAGSRGLDTVAIRHVLNYDFPNATADYIHRCGRTGRVGSVKDCRVTNFISTPLEINVVQKIERAIRRMKPIPIFDIQDSMSIKESDTLDVPKFDNINEIDEKQEFSIPY